MQLRISFDLAYPAGEKGTGRTLGRGNAGSTKAGRKKGRSSLRSSGKRKRVELSDHVLTKSGKRVGERGNHTQRGCISNKLR